MQRVFKNLTVIFYFPLVIVGFSFLFAGLVSFVPFFDKFSLSPTVTDGSFSPGETWAYFHNAKVEPPRTPVLATKPTNPSVLAATAGEKWVDVNLSSQTLSAFEPDGRLFMQVPISSGLWGATPTGTFRIWIKLRYTKMSGGSQAKGTYYYLPNVPCTQYFYEGYGLHGTYWHNNFGHPMSHGCVNMRTSDACRLFEWTSPPVGSSQNSARPSENYSGTRVVIHD